MTRNKSLSQHAHTCEKIKGSVAALPQTYGGMSIYGSICVHRKGGIDMQQSRNQQGINLPGAREAKASRSS